MRGALFLFGAAEEIPMSKDLNKIFGEAEVAEMTKSWMAFSATNIIFCEGNLILGVRNNAVERSIPEAGDFALIGGFNTVVTGPAMFEEIANAHVEDQLGIELEPSQCSDFLQCEYNMLEITKPLKTPNGEIPIKRAAFDRIVHITEQQLKVAFDYVARNDGKIKHLYPIGRDRFGEIKEDCSFPEQLSHVEEAFDNFSTELPRKVGWIK